MDVVSTPPEDIAVVDVPATNAGVGHGDVDGESAMGYTLFPSAQTERRGNAGPV
jgi:hypothetical protein